MATELAISERKDTSIQRRADMAVDPFEPQDWKGLLELASMISKTAFAPKDFIGKPEACAIAMLYGKQLGVPALQAIQNICVINGRPSAYGDLFWAIILSHPELEDVVEKDEDTKAYVKLTRRGRTPKEVTFTKQDAITAGLWDKPGPWKNYPKVMLLWRARTNAARALFADALKGVTSSFEAEDSGPIIEGQPMVSMAEVDQQTTTPAAKITQDQAREFGLAWKASGFTIDQAKASLESICSVKSSLDIPGDKYQDAMRWATKNPNWPISHDEKLCRELFHVLGYDLVKQAAVIEESKGDWVALAMKLNKELPVEN